ncbi:hypothetical protein E2C01_021905 [Portunus trituberculatus]|uniref:Uncharacterized protein n=1 Tax=Portunus trituberculatus TaxID=210409 RepID=A0A5B7E5V1_PORTR|nr:hypothetical protein [Portunus trituberculatus]
MCFVGPLFSQLLGIPQRAGRCLGVVEGAEVLREGVCDGAEALLGCQERIVKSRKEKETRPVNPPKC